MLIQNSLMVFIEKKTKTKKNPHSPYLQSDVSNQYHVHLLFKLTFIKVLMVKYVYDTFLRIILHCADTCHRAGQVAHVMPDMPGSAAPLSTTMHWLLVYFGIIIHTYPEESVQTNK